MPRAATEAEHLLKDLGLTNVPIKPSKVCEAMSSQSYVVSLEEKPMISEGFLGISMGDVNGAAILINSNIKNPHRKRFTAAHEIGHVHLHIQTNQQSNFKCSDKDISAGDNSNDSFEKEANEFASSLLMPTFAASPLIHKNDLSWVLVKRLKKLCDVSLEAAARRTVALSKDSCCLIIHKQGDMWFPIKSQRFSPFIPTQPFPSYLDTHEEGNGSGSLPDGMDECDFSDWGFPDNATGKLYYSSIHNSEFNRTMTLLLHDEEPEEEEYIEPYF